MISPLTAQIFQIEKHHRKPTSICMWSRNENVCIKYNMKIQFNEKENCVSLKERDVAG